MTRERLGQTERAAAAHAALGNRASALRLRLYSAADAGLPWEFPFVRRRGRVVEVGKHDDLLAQPTSVYSKLYSLQAFEGQRPGQIRPHPTIQ